MKKDFKYILAKTGGKLYRDYLEPSAFKGTPAVVDKIGSKITDPIFYKTSYNMVGSLGYRKGSNPALGSVAYTGIHTILKLLFSLLFITSGAGVWLLKGLWNVSKGLFSIIGKLFCLCLKSVVIGCFKIISGIITLIF